VSAATRSSLLADFEAARIDPASFRHADHIRVAWELLRRDPLPRAMEAMAEGLKRVTARAGRPERYHETITWAWVLLIADRMARRGAGLSFEEFAAANADLLDSGRLAGWYREETLASAAARRAFLLPDRVPGAS
jgi:hypothetical protein